MTRQKRFAGDRGLARDGGSAFAGDRVFMRDVGWSFAGDPGFGRDGGTTFIDQAPRNEDVPGG